jgi:hypothetical protein
MGMTPGLVTLHSRAARLLATEVLLADLEALQDGVLESCLYILRDRLKGTNSRARRNCRWAPSAASARARAPAWKDAHRTQRWARVAARVPVRGRGKRGPQVASPQRAHQRPT